MKQLGYLDSLIIREKKKYTSIPGNWKLTPVCCLADISEEEIYYAVAEGGAVSDINAFRKAPSFTLYLLNKKGEQILYFQKHAGLFGNKLEIYDATEELLGVVQRHKTVKTLFQALESSGDELCDVKGISENPETFQILKVEKVLGKISRRPVRIAEQGVASNDHFGIVFPFEADVSEKGILLGALFLIDLTF